MGCDKNLESGVVMDKCRICGGNSSECKPFRGRIQRLPAQFEKMSGEEEIWQVIWRSSRCAYEAYGFKSVDMLSFYYYSLLIIGRWNLNSLVCDFVSNCLEPWVSVIWGERQFSLVGLEWGCLIQGSLAINQRWRQLEEMQWLDDRTRKRGSVYSSYLVNILMKTRFH